MQYLVDIAVVEEVLLSHLRDVQGNHVITGLHGGHALSNRLNNATTLMAKD